MVVAALHRGGAVVYQLFGLGEADNKLPAPDADSVSNYGHYRRFADSRL